MCVFPEKACCKHNIKPSPKEPESEFQGVSERIERIDARRNAALVNRYGYYCVPSVFLRGEKLYECSPADDWAAIRQHLLEAFEAAIANGTTITKTQCSVHCVFSYLPLFVRVFGDAVQINALGFFDSKHEQQKRQSHERYTD